MSAEGWTNGLVGVSLGPRGRYRLERLIDQGGMAAVFEALDSHLHRQVAVKLIRPALRDDPGFARRFEREARLVAHLDHPHILSVHDFGETEASDGDAPPGLLYLVMRLVRGTSLRRFLSPAQEPPPWTPDKILRLARQILPALDYAHSRGIIHRDFKPENVLLEPQASGDGYHAFLADFGLAKAAELDPDQSRLTQTGQILGTPFYMAPEQWLGEPPDATTDEYAVGILLYELLTGEVPYQASTPMAVGQRALEARLTPPRLKNPAVSDAIARVVTRAVARESGLRYPSCAELLTALTTAIEHDPARTIVQSVPTVQAPPEPKPAPAPTPKPISPVPFIAIGSVLAAVLTLVVAGRVFGWFGPSDPGGTAATPAPTPSAAVAAIASPLVAPSTTATLITRTVAPTATTPARAPTPTSGPTPGPTIGAALNARGSLRQSGTTLPMAQFAKVSYRNLIGESRIDNPHDAAGRPLRLWDSGFALRYSQQGEYRLFIASGGKWWFELHTFGSTTAADNVIVLDSGTLRNLDADPDGYNLLQVVITDTDGYFFVNGAFVTTLDLSGGSSAGGVTLPAGDFGVTTGYIDTDRVDGALTNYSGFSVRELKNSTDGSTVASPYSLSSTSSSMGTRAMGVNTRDAVIFASFNNPDADKWDFGFLFRESKKAEMYRLVITSDDGKWWLRRLHHDGSIFADPTPAPSDYLPIASGTPKNLDTKSDGYNDLLLIALGSNGYFFLNGTYVDTFDLSDNLSAGDVEVGTGFFSGYTATLTYDSFSVWSPSS